MMRFEILNLANLSSASSFETNPTHGLYLVIFLWNVQYMYVLHTHKLCTTTRSTWSAAFCVVNSWDRFRVGSTFSGVGQKIVTFSFEHNFRERCPNATIEVSFAYIVRQKMSFCIQINPSTVAWCAPELAKRARLARNVATNPVDTRAVSPHGRTTHKWEK